MAVPQLDAHDVTAGYGPQDVLHGICLTLRQGELVGVIGPNGAGKSTLLRVLSGTLTPRGGYVQLSGTAISALSARDRARRIAFVPQVEPTLFDFSVRDVVLMGRHAHVRGLGGERREDFSAALRAMAATDTLHLADRPITSLSGGEHRRALIARALAQDAPILLLDEPTAHLDVPHQVDVLAVVRRLVDTRRASALAALHDLNLAAGFCDRVVLISDGRVEADGAPAEVLTSVVLTRVYGDGILVSRNPASGAPIILPTPPTATPRASGAIRIHVICGGGTGAAAIAELLRRGFAVTAGVLNRLDSDEEACAALGVQHVAEAPFSPVSAAARAACEELISGADAVVVTEVPIGKGNLPNLEIAAWARAAGKRVFLMGGRDIGARDFTGGAASGIWGSLLEDGAEPIPDARALASVLHQE